MNELLEIAKYAGGGGVVVATMFILAKSGLLKVHIGKNGNDKEALENHEKRLDIANREMGEVKVILEGHDKRFDRIESGIDDIKNHLMK